MMLGLLCFGGLAIGIGYMCLIGWATCKIQDWATENNYPPIALPWAFMMVGLVALPVSIFVAVSA